MTLLKKSYSCIINQSIIDQSPAFDRTDIGIETGKIFRQNLRREREPVMRILVVEDEKTLCETVAKGLRLDGYEVDTCFDGNTALDTALTESYDLIILDLNLPGMDGMEVLRNFRKEDAETSVLILSARGQLRDKIDGLDSGANDYLCKPFHFEELEARVRSLTRRRVIQNNLILSCGELSLDTKARTVSARGTELSLTRKEFGLLEYLMLHPEQPLSQEELIQHVWDGSVDSFSNSIRVHISALRKKLRTALGYDPITNRIGQGYMIGANTNE